MIGTTISHYRIIDKLGEGGMGVVYKAQDTRLDRVVALKFLPSHLGTSGPEQARFMQEAKAASALNHPNICGIHAIGEHEGRYFIDMECVDGQTLRARVARGPLKQDDAIVYAIQIGDALHEAHTKGIAHRDVKSENIMVNAKNQIKVMDFGLAKLRGSVKITKSSSTLGTLAYMAPEQIQGGEVDARSDIFSFGVVLFEMLTGHMPFRGDHEPALMYSILNEEPESVRNARQDVSPEIDRIIHRALEKDPEDRYQSATDMVSELRREQKKSAGVTRPSAGGPTGRPMATDALPASQPALRSKKKTMLWGALGVGLAAVGFALYVFTGRHNAIDSLAVLPFENVGADPNTEYLSDGITESLINTLSQLSNLTVMSRSSVFHYKGRDTDPQKAGKELGVKAVLTGRVTQRDNSLQISTELVDVSNNSHIWGKQYNKKLSDILTVQEEISKEMSQQLRVRLVAEDANKLSKRSTESTEAYQLYLKGRYYWNKRTTANLRTAIEYFNRAIEKDPGYALAYAGLASAYAIFPEYSGLPADEYFPKTERAAGKAMEIDATLAEPHAALGLFKFEYLYEWAEAEKELLRAIELDPSSPTTHQWRGNMLFLQGRFEEAMTEMRRAQELDPLSLIININVGLVFYYSQRYDLAAEQYKKVLDLDPNFALAHSKLGEVYAQQGNFEAAIIEARKVGDIAGPDEELGPLGCYYARAGRKDEAEAILNRLLQRSRAGYALSVEIASVYMELGNTDKVFEWLNKGYAEHHSSMGYLKIDPQWRNLHSDPRYAALLKTIGLAN
jgi:serine/threonine protein kinase/Flp pilus assembly protein TadD